MYVATQRNKVTDLIREKEHSPKMYLTSSKHIETYLLNKTKK